ncbi:peptidyl-prolyl cis-trans isomerase [Paenibacillus sp. RRE4]|uniref:peptidyl-prolyl cis-trans isomerase n=1 Tax=Paenibacillus sp. RRE4 TaxID=2962587 RepID=UPI002881BC00|nr:peptidyl-prolyl cis-trans isomerase [Paenibacillus sp. RRE4]MDT0126273.1 peptidyl-prolyl cis-trans isomerase [Paenibacillus sp. RRE4]
MTRQEKGLWTAVVILTLGVLVMGTFMAMQVLHQGKEDAETPHDGSKEEGSTVATINGEVITDKAWTDALKRRYGSEILLQMLNRKAVYAEALQRNLVVTPKEIAREMAGAMDGYDSEKSYYDAMKSQLGLSKQDLELEAGYRLLLEKIATAGIQVKDDDIQKYWVEHREDYITPEKYDLSIIVVKEKSDSEAMLTELRNGKDFEEMARSESEDSYSRDAGGKLGWIDQNDPFQPKSILQQAANMSIGDIAGPVKVEDGYAIIRLNDKVERQEQSAKEVHEEIRMELALSQADPLPQVEQMLRDKYEAVIISEIPAS